MNVNNLLLSLQDNFKVKAIANAATTPTDRSPVVLVTRSRLTGTSQYGKAKGYGLNPELIDNTPKVDGKDKGNSITSASSGISSTPYISRTKISSNTERSNYTSLHPITTVHKEAMEPSRTEAPMLVTNNILAKSSPQAMNSMEGDGKVSDTDVEPDE